MNSLTDKITAALGTKRNLLQNDLIIKKPRQNCERLLKNFFSLPCISLAESLLGKLLVRKLEDDTLLKGRIVEAECYLGVEDKASHSFNGRRTVCNEPMYMEAGTAYVYIIYGIYHCFNISSAEAGGAVLIRALEPIEGIEQMQIFRTAKRSKAVKIQDLCKGPSNLCISMNINKAFCNKIDLTSSSLLWLENDPNFEDNFSIVRTSRVGISAAADEWRMKPLRFYINGNVNVSKRDRKKEKQIA